jgi:hypothetical protein
MSFTKNFSAALAITAFAAVGAGAQVTSTLRTIALTATKGELVTLTAPTPADQAITLTDGIVNPFPTAFTTTVGWDVNTSTTTTVKLVAYFDNATAALTNGTSNIASGLIEVSNDAGSTWHPMTDAAVGTAGVTGASYTLYTSAVTSGGNKKASAPVSFLVRVNLTTNPSTVSGPYTGTLKLMAICN